MSEQFGKVLGDARFVSVLLAACYGVMIFLNSVSQAPDVNNPDVTKRTYSDISIDLKPDGITFAVWGIIFALELAFTVAQFYYAYRSSSSKFGQEFGKYVTVRSRYLTCVAFLAAGAWPIIDKAGLNWPSVVEMYIYAVALIGVYKEFGIRYCGSEEEKSPPGFIQFIVFSGFSANLAWVVVACNLNMLQAGVGVELGYVVDEYICIGFMALCAFISTILLVWRFDFVYAAVTMWALWGVQRAQLSRAVPKDSVLYTCLLLIAVIGTVLIVTLTQRIKSGCCAPKTGTKNDNVNHQLNGDFIKGEIVV